MQLDYTCPICGRLLKRPSLNHAKTHGLGILDWHRLRIEKQTGVPLRDLLRDLYIVQQLGTVEIGNRLAITYRGFRDLMEQCEIPMRSAGECIRISWDRDDGTRSAQTSRMFREINERMDLTGENNPSKRPEVRRKISRIKKINNPAMKALDAYRRKLHREGSVTLICRNCGKPFIIRKSHADKYFCCSRACSLQDRGRTSIELTMEEALFRLGITATPQHPVGIYVVDFALVPIKVAIECDGEYWHDPVRDARRDRRLYDRDWITIRFTETEINVDVDACVQNLVTKLYILGLDPPTF